MRKWWGDGWGKAGEWKWGSMGVWLRWRFTMCCNTLSQPNPAFSRKLIRALKNSCWDAEDVRNKLATEYIFASNKCLCIIEKNWDPLETNCDLTFSCLAARPGQELQRVFQVWLTDLVCCWTYCLWERHPENTFLFLFYDCRAVWWSSGQQWCCLTVVSEWSVEEKCVW